MLRRVRVASYCTGVQDLFIRCEPSNHPIGIWMPITNQRRRDTCKVLCVYLDTKTLLAAQLPPSPKIDSQPGIKLIS